MTTESVETRSRQKVDWRRAEFVLTGLAFLAFLGLGIRLTTIYSGLPAHPLFIHVPVILIPTTIVAAIVFMVRTDWFARWGIALAVVSIVAMGSIFVTMQAGSALQAALHLQGRAAHLISQHSQAAHILTIVYVLFTAVLILAFAAMRISSGMPTGLGIVDRLLRARAGFTGLRVLLVILALAGAVLVFRVGDLGAKAVWQGRIQAAQSQAAAGSAGRAGAPRPPA